MANGHGYDPTECQFDDCPKCGNRFGWDHKKGIEKDLIKRCHWCKATIIITYTFTYTIKAYKEDKPTKKKGGR